MQRFARLLDDLSHAQSRSGKLALLAHYFRSAPDPDRGWALAMLTDGVAFRLPLRRIIGELMASRIDPVLYALSRDYVGDTAETVALLWPEPSSEQPAAPGEPPSLDAVVRAVTAAPPAARAEAVAAILDRLDANGRWAFLKLLGGAPRVGVSARLAKIGVADAFATDVRDIEEVWHALAPPYGELFAWLEKRGERPDASGHPVFRPLMLAVPLEEADLAGLRIEDFAAEWKWDGIRVQVVAQGRETRVYSRTGDDITPGFPDIGRAFLGHDVTLDGELLVVRSGVVAPFNDLQQRLNRKAVSARMLKEHPAHLRLYDVLRIDGEDLRPLPFSERRRRLEEWHARAQPPLADLSDLIAFGTLDELARLRLDARQAGIEGLMLKRRESPYLSGRPKGHWFKWKRDALTLDCVLMYAQRGSGKRSSFYSDYTFGVWRRTETGETDLVPVGKAYSGFSDEELRQLDRFIRSNTVESFGPVRAVRPELVLEVAFDAVHRSARHKSGIAMRFPRIKRIRWDKPAGEADDLDTAARLVGNEKGQPE
jgi:DNA ligase-1